MLMKKQNFHVTKKRIVVCLLFMMKYFFICMTDAIANQTTNSVAFAFTLCAL